MAIEGLKLNRAGMRELLRSEGVLEELRRRAEEIADRAGDGMEVDAEIEANRARASVRTESFGAMAAEATDRVLTRAIDAARE